MTTRSAKGQATRERIVRIATELFATAGYEGTSIETVLARSGISRGALYHHFEDKEALFVAVLEAMEATVAQATIDASRGIADPVAALQAALGAWLDVSRSPAIRQIVLIDAPSVVGWEKWREIDARFGFGLLKGSLNRIAAAGRIRQDRVEMLAHMLLAASMEVALVIARAADPEAASATGKAALGDMINKLLGPPSRRGVVRKAARPR